MQQFDKWDYMIKVEFGLKYDNNETMEAFKGGFLKNVTLITMVNSIVELFLP